MTGTYDGSVGSAGGLASVATEPDMTGLDTLSLLKQTVSQRMPLQPVTLSVPGIPVRLVCHTDIPEKLLKRWQRGAMPPEKRKDPNPSPLDVQQIVLSTAVLVNTNVRVEVRDKNNHDVWHVVEDRATHELLTLADKALLDLFGVIDTQSALNLIFGRESDQIRASAEVLEKAGWASEGGPVEDDTDDPR